MATSKTMPVVQERLLAKRGLAEVYFHAASAQHSLLKTALYQLSLNFGKDREDSRKLYESSLAQLLNLCRLLEAAVVALREDLETLDELTLVGSASADQVQNLAFQLDDHHTRCRELKATVSTWRKDAEEKPRRQ